MTGRFLPAALAAALGLGTLTAVPAQADDVGKAIGNIAKGYLQQEQDKAAFAQAQQTNTAAAYRQYLAQFPSGMYASYARDRVIALQPGAARNTLPPQGNGRGNSQAGNRDEVTYGRTAATGEVNLGLTRDDRARLQRQLTALGYNTNGADGIFGSGSRRAIANWQRANGKSGTGFLTAHDVQTIQAQAGNRGNAATPGRSASSGDRPQIEENLIGLNGRERAEMQTRLTMLGYDTRGTDGNYGAATRAAIRRWQGDNGMAQTGYFTADQIAKLRAQARR